MQTLASYACDPAQSRGRRFHEAAAPTRSDFQRDRDRIVHSTAFRRLVYKTQVFVNHEGDLFRTRLTHSLEVAQLGRSIARSLGLQEDLVEAICLAHDLGHTPFGHAGQDALNECMKPHGGFEHNLQSLRVVDRLEERYPQFDGLNLTFETREGILKHCSPANARLLEAREPEGVARRFLDGTQPSLEAQLCNLADAIAYNAHDVDDGVRSGLITMGQLREAVPLFARYHDATLVNFAAATAPLWQYLDQLHPLLWREGRDFPASPARMDTMLTNGVLRLSITFNPLHAQQKAASGELPKDSYGFGFSQGMLGNVHFVAIPVNARATAGAKVVANFLLSPQAQLRKADPAVWGDPSVLDPAKLTADERQSFNAVVPQDLPPMLGEPHSAWVEALEQEWLRHYGTH